MLKLVIPDLNLELYDEQRGVFVNLNSKGATIQVEHSLVSLSKWESKWEKPFLSKTEKTVEETIDYVRCMTITQNVNPEVYENLKYYPDIIKKVNKYIEAPMTATTFSENKNGKKSREIITAELIYYWMIALNVPFDCQKWHLNRLLTLIRVCEIKNQPPKKGSKRATASKYAALNAARRQQLNTKG